MLKVTKYIEIKVDLSIQKEMPCLQIGRFDIVKMTSQSMHLIKSLSKFQWSLYFQKKQKSINVFVLDMHNFINFSQQKHISTFYSRHIEETVKLSPLFKDTGTKSQ